MKALLLNGSPHPRGCTGTALSLVANELEAAGIGADFFQLDKKPIRGCIACGACSDGRGKCAFDDDQANRFLEKMDESDALVIGSPVYYAGANGALVALLNRAFYAGKSFAYKPGAVVVSARRAGTTATIDELSKFLSISCMPIVTSRYWTMVHGSNAEDVAKDREGVQIMRTLGKNLAWMMKSLDAGRAAGILPPPEEQWDRTDFNH